jgi:hypothetical protein
LPTFETETTSYFFNIHFNIILLYMFLFPKLSIPLRVSHWSSVSISRFPNACYVPCLSHLMLVYYWPKQGNVCLSVGMSFPWRKNKKLISVGYDRIRWWQQKTAVLRSVIQCRQSVLTSEKNEALGYCYYYYYYAYANKMSFQNVSSS